MSKQEFIVQYQALINKISSSALRVELDRVYQSILQTSN